MHYTWLQGVLPEILGGAFSCHGLLEKGSGNIDLGTLHNSLCSQAQSAQAAMLGPGSLSAQHRVAARRSALTHVAELAFCDLHMPFAPVSLDAAAPAAGPVQGGFSLTTTAVAAAPPPLPLVAAAVPLAATPTAVPMAAYRMVSTQQPEAMGGGLPQVLPVAPSTDQAAADVRSGVPPLVQEQAAAQRWHGKRAWAAFNERGKGLKEYWEFMQYVPKAHPHSFRVAFDDGSSWQYTFADLDDQVYGSSDVVLAAGIGAEAESGMCRQPVGGKTCLRRSDLHCRARMCLAQLARQWRRHALLQC